MSTYYSAYVNNKPVCLKLETVAQSRLFRIEQMSLRFSNGEQRVFERIRGSGRGGVVIIPLLDAQTVLLTREYAAGIERYEIGFPKGVCESGETPIQAANRELMEEVGYGAKSLENLKTLSILPGYFSAASELILARDLYEKKLPGDEPEEIEVIPWNINQIDQLISHDDFTDARSIAAIYILKNWIDCRLEKGDLD